MAQIGTDLSALGLGQTLGGLAAALPGFQGGAAGTDAGTALDTAGKQVSADFGNLAVNLQAAADQYEKTDSEQATKIDGADKTDDKDEKSPSSGEPPQPIPVDQVTYDRGNFPTGPDASRAAINQALDQLGITDPAARQRWANGYLTMALRESSYNPAAVNNWDINSKPPKSTYKVVDGYGNGCSRGLVQCVPGTFAQYHQPGTSNNIYDPVANVAASMNYVMGAYGVSRDGSNLAALIPQANPNLAGHGY